MGNIRSPSRNRDATGAGYDVERIRTIDEANETGIVRSMLRMFQLGTYKTCSTRLAVEALATLYAQTLGLSPARARGDQRCTLLDAAGLETSRRESLPKSPSKRWRTPSDGRTNTSQLSIRLGVVVSPTSYLMVLPALSTLAR